MTMMLTPTPGISAFPDDGNMLSWTATITGPTETPYSGLNLKLSFAFPSNYPYAPPTVLFKTPIYHPNVDFSGRICLDILKEKWSAVYNVQTVLLSLQSLLGEPNKYVDQLHAVLASSSLLTECHSASPLNGEAATLHEKNPEEYAKKVLARHQDIDD
jgi:ubiquitin-conjugating enzyme E2 C